MNNGLIICVPDLHVPYQHKRAWALMLEIIDYVKPQLTMNLGDFADNKAFSRHRRKFGEKYNPDKDMELVNREAKNQEKAAGGRLMMLEGNHDRWLSSYVAENAPAVENMLPTLGSLYGLAQEPVAYQEIYKIGKVGYSHDLGHYGRQALHQTLATAGGNIVFGHTHRGGVAYSGTVEGDRWFSLNCGWLGDVTEIRYMNRAATRDWQLGFGSVQYADGLAFAQFHPMVEHNRKIKCTFKGKSFRG